MNLVTEPYLAQQAHWPQTGRHILAQYDEHSIIVYQAYRPAIGRFAATHGYFGVLLLQFNFRIYTRSSSIVAIPLQFHNFIMKSIDI